MHRLPEKISPATRVGFYLLTVLAIAGIAMFVVTFLRDQP
jgi:hypothetical protein